MRVKRLLSSKVIVLKGVPASVHTRVIGSVCVVRTLADCSRMAPGGVLVAREASPAYFTAINMAGAIVTEVGGVLSHAAILSRELGIPCVVNAENATAVLKDGMQVIVDGEHGSVYGNSR
jgi:phosphoenolpyruvate synthase/pyruvate phosphate dikinase